MKLPDLFKKTNTGAIQCWGIRVFEVSSGAIIQVDFGQWGTDKPQSTTDLISEGKNVGKKNETTPLQQAELEAKSKWEKQKKKGYVESIEAAQAGEVDDLIEGGIVPMLAHKFTDHGHKIKYPAAVQPKLDGIRCIAILKDGVCTLWSRTRKQITSMPHITAKIEKVFEDDIVLDGELYNHAFKANFEHIVSMVRQEEPAEGHTDVQYHIYDIANDMKFFDRNTLLASHFSMDESSEDPLRLVPTYWVKTEDEVTEFFERFRSNGYEGAMLRNPESYYVNKRSYDLQKVKEFDDAEFPIIGVEEGRGKLAGHAIFVCKTDSGKEFLAKMKGDTAQLKKFFEDHTLWKGKQLTVRYQGLTGKEQVPRFPVGVAIRDYE